MVSNIVIAEVVGSVLLAVGVYYLRSPSVLNEDPSQELIKLSKTKKSKRNKAAAPSSRENVAQHVPGGGDLFADPEVSSKDDQPLDIIATFGLLESAKEKKKKPKKLKVNKSSNIKAPGSQAQRMESLPRDYVPASVTATSENFDHHPWTTVERSRKSSRNLGGATDTSVTTKTATEAASTDSPGSTSPELMPTSSNNRLSLTEELGPSTGTTAANDVESTFQPRRASAIAVASEFQTHAMPASQFRAEQDSLGATDNGMTTDDDGFAVVGRSRHRSQRTTSSHSDVGGSKSATSATEFHTKTQRKNQNKAAQRKAEKSAAQELQSERFDRYQRERDQARMEEQQKDANKGRKKGGPQNIAGTELGEVYI